MTCSDTDTAGLICVPDAIPLQHRVRHFLLARELLTRRATARADLPDGYCFQFAADDFNRVARFIDNERRCCPFLSFDLALTPGSGPISLRVTGPTGTREVLQAELELAGSCGCDTKTAKDTGAVKWTTAGAVFASVGVCAACCLLPAILAGLGVAGSLVSTLDSFAPYKWIFIILTMAFLGYGFYVAYWKPNTTCVDGAAIPAVRTSRSVRAGLWIGTILAVSGIVYGYLEPWLSRP